MSPARFLAAAVAIYGIAISAGVVLYLVFRDSLEDLSEDLRRRLAERRGPVPSRRARRVQSRAAPQIWESASVGVGAELRGWPRQQLLLLRGRAPIPRRLAWAVLAVVALAAATVLGATHDFGSSSETGARASARLQAGPWTTSRLWRPPHGRASLPKRAAKQTARHAPPAKRAQVQHTQVVSNLQPVSDHTAPVGRTTFTAAAPQGGGPTPLRAPKSGSAPTPLRSP